MKPGAGPRRSGSPLQTYLRTLRERLGLIALITASSRPHGGLSTWPSPTRCTRPRPSSWSHRLSSDDPVLSSLPLIRESNDPTRDVETAARLVTSRNVAQRVKRQLKLEDSAAAHHVSTVTAAPGGAEQHRRRHRRGRDPGAARDHRQRLCARRGGRAHGRAAAPARPELIRGPARAGRSRPGRRRRPTAPGGCVAASSRARRRLRAGGDPTMRVETTRRRADVPVVPAAHADHPRRDHRRPGARRRRRVCAPGARPAPAPRGAAARALQPADPRPDPGEKKAPDVRAASAGSASGPRRKRRKLWPPASLRRSTWRRSARCARCSPQRSGTRHRHPLDPGHRRRRPPRARPPPRSTWRPRSRSPASA